MDILHPIHKSNEKDDQTNFCGISIASCFSILFIKILKNRLDSYLEGTHPLSKNQRSGKTGSRTADHLMVIKYLMYKIVKKLKSEFMLASSIWKKHMILQTGNYCTKSYWLSTVYAEISFVFRSQCTIITVFIIAVVRDSFNQYTNRLAWSRVVEYPPYFSISLLTK